VELPFDYISSDTAGGVGGTCVLRGCVPKKLMVYASEYATGFKDSVGFGCVQGSSPGGLKPKRNSLLLGAQARRLQWGPWRRRQQQARALQPPASHPPSVAASALLLRPRQVGGEPAAAPQLEHLPHCQAQGAAAPQRRIQEHAQERECVRAWAGAWQGGMGVVEGSKGR
jgi:hypothetical protein